MSRNLTMARTKWLGGLLALLAMTAAEPASIDGEIALATPIGITIQVPVGNGKSDGVDLSRYPVHQTKDQYYADAKGMALYTYDKDPPNVSSCAEECAR